MNFLLAQAESREVMSWIFPLVVVSLSMCIPIVAIITEHFQKKEKMRLMAKAIEHGVDPESFNLEDPKKPRLPYRSGMVMVAVGAGLILADKYADVGMAGLHFPLMVGGLIVGFVGLALLVNDRMNRDRFDDRTPGS